MARRVSPERLKIIAEIKEKYESGDIARNELRRELVASGISASQASNWARRIEADEVLDPYAPVKSEESPRLEGEIKFEKMYAYNSDTDDYIFFTDKLLGQKIVLKGDRVREMLKRYSRFDGDTSTLNEIANNFGLRRATAVFILRALGFTHDSLPVTDEEVMTEDPDTLVESVLAEKKFTFNREYEKRSWTQTNIEAKKWRDFEQGVLNPFKEFVERFEYTKPAFRIKKEDRPKPDSCFMVGVSDTHFGANSAGENLWHGSDFSIEIAEENYTRYVESFCEMVEDRNQQSSLLKILAFGDIIHGLKGETEKGTNIEAFPLGTKQIEVPFRCLDRQIEMALQLGFEQIEVEAVTGNHSHFGDWALYKLIETAYRNDDRVTVNIATARWKSFVFKNSLFVMEHGASPFYKSKVPTKGSGRDTYIQKLLLSLSEDLARTKHRYFLTADQHSFSHEDAEGFEFLRFGTLVSGDKYADELNLHSRPRQTVPEVDEQGIKSTHSFYFD